MISCRIKITPHEVLLNGRRVELSSTGDDLITELYRMYLAPYPKFFKMDALCKLGYVGAEMMLDCLSGSGKGKNREIIPCSDRAVILFNRSSSLNADRHFESTVADRDNFFPSPAVFVYTLPNIVTGEIAIRNRYCGETSFYLLKEKDWDIIARHIGYAFDDSETVSVIGGWVDYMDSGDFEARMFIADREGLCVINEMKQE